MFGTDCTENLHLATKAESLKGNLMDQLKNFYKAHPDTALIIIDTLQKICELGDEKCSYANDYEVITTLKQFTDVTGVCLLLVHHTRKQQADDKFEMISGTNGLMGAADGAFLLHKEKRVSSAAILNISGRDQADQTLYLNRNEETLIWDLDKAEMETFKPKPDPVIEAVAGMIKKDHPCWCGTATELVEALGLDLTPHIHERHVFDCENEYGEIAPQQEKTLEALGIPLPHPDQENSKTNNRKVMFDSICRTMLIEIAKSHGLEMQEEPQYGGREYLEKQDYILMRQKERLAEQEQKLSEVKKEFNQKAYDVFTANIELRNKTVEIASANSALKQKSQQLEELTMKVDDLEDLIADVSEVAYDKAVSQVTRTVREETTEANIAEIEFLKEWVTSPQSKGQEKHRSIVLQALDASIRRIRNAVGLVTKKVISALHDPIKREQNLKEIRTETRESVLGRLKQKQAEADQINAGRRPVHRSELSI